MDTDYTPPPRIGPPPAGWRPEFVVRHAPPATLPTQDHDAIDGAEATASTVTRVLGVLAAMAIGVLLMILASRSYG